MLFSKKRSNVAKWRLRSCNKLDNWLVTFFHFSLLKVVVVSQKIVMILANNCECIYVLDTLLNRSMSNYLSLKPRINNSCLHYNAYDGSILRYGVIFWGNSTCSTFE